MAFSKNAPHRAAVTIIRQQGLEPSKTRPSTGSQMPGRDHALVQNAHDINCVVNGRVKNPVVPDGQDLEACLKIQRDAVFVRV